MTLKLKVPQSDQTIINKLLTEREKKIYLKPTPSYLTLI